MRRLIPTVAAASLSFTGCIPGAGNNGNNGNNRTNGDLDGGSGVDVDAGDQDAAEDTSSSDELDALDVSDIVQRRDVRDTQTDSTDTGNLDDAMDTLDDTGGDAAADTTTSDSGDSGDGGSSGTPLATPNDDGTLTRQEVEDLCRGFSNCDPQYFSQTYSSVGECATTTYENIEYYITYYEQYYGAACAVEFEAFIECQLGRAVCLNGQVDYDYSGVDCYAEHDYYSVCNP